MKTLAVRAAVTLVACASAGALFAPAAAAVDIYSYANGCYALHDTTANRYVVRDGARYAATATSATAATPFRMQATALGSYLLYGPDGQMLSVGTLGPITPTATPGPAADWRLIDVAGILRMTNVFTGLHLGVGLGGRLVQTLSTAPRWSFASAQGCASFPEVEVNVKGQPFKGSHPSARVRGFVDTHTHVSAFQFLGGRFHCGKPWSPYGVTVALVDCVDHGPDGSAGVAETFLSGGSPGDTHSPQGWPGFTGWPRDESLTHEGTYWKWIERAWRSGLRIMVNDLVENRALCELYPLKQNNCNEMASAYQQANDMYALQDYVDAQYGGPGKGFLRIVKTPAEARRVVNDGKLAMVLGVEISEVLNCGQTLDLPHCTTTTIDDELDRLESVGVRSFFPIHKFDNALGGVKFDGGTTGILVNTGNKYATGKFWTAEHCEDPDHDNSPGDVTQGHGHTFSQFLDPVLTQPLFEGQLPIYPNPPMCNPKGLTALGEYVIRQMMDRGMIIETDHMSMKARRQAMAILEAEGYGGVTSSHSWGDPGSQKRIQALGGLIGPISSEADRFVADWREIKQYRSPNHFFGVGFGSDINGLHSQPHHRSNPGESPVQYPFLSFDRGSVINKQRSGTRVYDVNSDGVDHYGLYPDWIEDMRRVGGRAILEDLANGAEAYLQMWERAEAAAQ